MASDAEHHPKPAEHSAQSGSHHRMPADSRNVGKFTEGGPTCLATKRMY